MTTTPRDPFGYGQRHVPTFPSDQRQSSTERELEYANRKLREQEDVLNRLHEEPRPCAVVIELRGDRHMLISFGAGNTLMIRQFKGAQPGDRVLVNRNTMQADELIKDDAQAGTIVTVERVSDDKQLVEATLLTTLRSFKCPDGMQIRKGERVILDPSMAYVIGTLGMPPPGYSFAPTISVAWDDIGGHAEAKAQLREAIELPLAHPALFKAYGKRAIKGVLLWGPPGTGKTILAKAAATAIAKAHGHQAAAGFVYIKGPELLNAYIGKSEEAIRGLFAAAREHKAEHGYPSVIFIDECDALLGRRDRGVNVSVNATTVPQFLAEMDGMEDPAAMFILATNIPEALDPAVTRDGRVDRKVRIDRPSKDDARAIFEIHLKGRPLNGRSLIKGRENPHTKLAIEALFSDERIVIPSVDVVEGSVIRRAAAMRLRDVVSGAMIAEIVERASSRAILRDVEAGDTEASGITPKDLVWAIDKSLEAIRDMIGGAS